MKYLLLVSHGDFSTGLRQTLSMFAGDPVKSVVAVGLKKDEAASTLEKRFEGMMSDFPEDSEFVILADVIGGSPLTTVCNVLSKHGKLQGSLVMGGMNFPMALTATLSKDSLSNEDLQKKITTEATDAIKVFDTTQSSDDLSDDDI